MDSIINNVTFHSEMFDVSFQISHVISDASVHIGRTVHLNHPSMSSITVQSVNNNGTEIRDNADNNGKQIRDNKDNEKIVIIVAASQVSMFL